MIGVRVHIPRPKLTTFLADRTEQGAPLIIGGSLGAGKTTLLCETVAELARRGWAAAYLDLMAAASSPAGFVRAARRSLAHGGLAGAAPPDVSRSHGPQAVEAVFNRWRDTTSVRGRSVALVLDEATEIRALARFAGLRQVEQRFAEALSARPRGTLLATSFPHLARQTWSLEVWDVPPLGLEELAAALPDWSPENIQALVRTSFGWPAYVRILVEAAPAGTDLSDTWAREMVPGGRLERACRHHYEVLLLRSRGYGTAKATLASVAEEPGLNLTALADRLGRSPGAVRDYLHSLVSVDVLRVHRKRYFFVDGLLSCWVRLHARGYPLDERALHEALPDGVATQEILQTHPPNSVQHGAPVAEEPATSVAPLRRVVEYPMEID